MIVGPAVSFGTFNTKLAEDTDKYSRLNLTGFRREFTRNLRVAVAGLGALGGEVVRYLGLMGIGRIILVDFDIVKSGNLPYSSLLSGAASIGCAKSAVISKAVREHFADTEPEEFCCEIADIGFAILRDVDLILSCVDSDWARLDIAYIARQLSIPVCDAGLGAPDYRHGRVSFFTGAPSNACYGCLLSSSRRRELLLERDYSIASCYAPPREGEEVLPGTPMMASIVAALQVDYGLRELETPSDATYTIRLDLANAPRMERIAHPRADSCPFHEPLATRVPAANDQTARDLLGEFGPGMAVQLDWPICMECCCGECGYRWRPMRRTRLLRRLATCPDCGSAGVMPVETLEMIGPGSPWEETPLLRLGLPDRHLHAVVEAGG